MNGEGHGGRSAPPPTQKVSRQNPSHQMAKDAIDFHEGHYPISLMFNDNGGNLYQNGICKCLKALSGSFWGLDLLLYILGNAGGVWGVLMKLGRQGGPREGE